jgi:hypothetical protein
MSFPKATRGLEPIREESYSELFYMPLYTFVHDLLNVLVEITNKM